MKVAIVHDWLVTYAGAERVLEQILLCYPEADVFSTVDFIPPLDRAFLRGKPVITTFIQKLPFAKTKYRHYLPLMPLAIEQLDLSSYELIISSSHAVAKGVLVSPDQLHICLCYTPMRYAWDLQNQYLKESGLDKGFKGWMTRWLLHRMRIWDVRSANGVDQFIAISHYISRRINKAYRRHSVVIYPPVDTQNFVTKDTKQDYYVTASRMVPYKKIPLIVEAFAKMPDKKLIVIGDGPDWQRCLDQVAPNIQLLGHQPTSVLIKHLQNAKAFVFAAEEDFGIAPLEAQACGTPVIAFAKGAAMETLLGQDTDHPTAVFFKEQTTESICLAVQDFETMHISALACRENAHRFSIDRFRSEFSAFVTQQCQDFKLDQNIP